MLYAAVVRFVRRRVVLGLIFSFSLLYFLINFFGKQEYLDMDDSIPFKRTQPFIWRTLQQHNSSDDSDVSCRNSVQGKDIIVDDKGYVCPRNDILPSGCCNDILSSLTQYSCESCKRNNCCAVYEYCVSCCLHPDKKKMLENVLGKATEQNNVLFASVTDHFELCLAKCRTSSQSVQHENSYKDPKAKYCYGETAPGVYSENDI